MSSVCRQTCFIEEFVNVKCCNCGGGHVPEFPECPVAVQSPYVEVVKSVIGARGHSSEEDMVMDAPQPVVNVVRQSSDLDTHIVKVDILVFIATVINYTVHEVQEAGHHYICS